MMGFILTLSFLVNQMGMSPALRHFIKCLRKEKGYSANIVYIGETGSNYIKIAIDDASPEKTYIYFTKSTQILQISKGIIENLYIKEPSGRVIETIPKNMLEFVRKNSTPTKLKTGPAIVVYIKKKGASIAERIGNLIFIIYVR